MVKIKIGGGELIHGNVLEVLKKLPSESVDCIITSPPYWGLRKYPDEANIIWGGDPNCEHEWETIVKPKERGGMGKSSWERPSRKVNPGNEPQVSSFCKKCGAWYGQLGLEPTPELYVEHLGLILKEIYRVLKPTGTFWLNIGDTYSGGGHGGNTYYEVNGKLLKDKKYGEGRNYVPYVDWSKIKIPRKCMLCIPERVLFKALEIGFIVRNKIVWYKPNHLPSSVKDRLANAWEYIYLLVKKPKGYYFNLDAIREPIVTDPSKISFNYRVREAKKGHFGIIGVRASEEEMEKYDRQGIRRDSKFPDWEEIKNDKESEITIGGFGRFYAWQRKVGRIKHDIAVGRVGNFSYSDPLHTKPEHPLGKNPGDVWDLTTEPFPEAHFAVFPVKLVVRCLAAGSPPDGVVLDPFMGSGTVGLACELLNHKMWDKIPKFEEIVNAEIVKSMDWKLRWIGVDIVSDYIDMAKRRIEKEVFSKAKTLDMFVRM